MGDKWKQLLNQGWAENTSEKVRLKCRLYWNVHDDRSQLPPPPLHISKYAPGDIFVNRAIEMTVLTSTDLSNASCTMCFNPRTTHSVKN